MASDNRRAAGWVTFSKDLRHIDYTTQEAIMATRICTHTAPDLDAALGTWLAARYLAHGTVSYGFVPAGETDTTADMVIDTGRVYDTATHRYDHHMPEWANRRDVCAAGMVYAAALARAATDAQRDELHALRPLVNLVTAIDHGAAPEWAYETGIAAIASSIRARLRGDDSAMLAALHQLIDDVASALWVREQVRREFADHAHPLSDKIVFIRNGSALMTRYALDTLGYELVLFVTDSRDKAPPTVTIGIQRANESPLHCGEIVDAIQARAGQAGEGEIVAELASWYRHPSGFFAGRGTAKNPDPMPVTERNLQILAALLVEVMREEHHAA